MLAADLSVPLNAGRVELLDVCLEFSQRVLPSIHPASVCRIPSTHIHVHVPHATRPETFLGTSPNRSAGNSIVKMNFGVRKLESRGYRAALFA